MSAHRRTPVIVSTFAAAALGILIATPALAQLSITPPAAQSEPPRAATKPPAKKPPPKAKAENPKR